MKFILQNFANFVLNKTSCELCRLISRSLYCSWNAEAKTTKCQNHCFFGNRGTKSSLTPYCFVTLSELNSYLTIEISTDTAAILSFVF